MENILSLDRLRQSVAVKELLQAKGQPMMRKTASVPNFSQVSVVFLKYKGDSLNFFEMFVFIPAIQALETKNGVILSSLFNLFGVIQPIAAVVII